MCGVCNSLLGHWPGCPYEEIPDRERMEDIEAEKADRDYERALNE